MNRVVKKFSLGTVLLISLFFCFECRVNAVVVAAYETINPLCAEYAQDDSDSAYLNFKFVLTGGNHFEDYRGDNWASGYELINLMISDDKINQCEIVDYKSKLFKNIVIEDNYVKGYFSDDTDFVHDYDRYKEVQTDVTLKCKTSIDVGIGQYPYIDINGVRYNDHYNMGTNELCNKIYDALNISNPIQIVENKECDKKEVIEKIEYKDNIVLYYIVAGMAVLLLISLIIIIVLFRKIKKDKKGE